MSSITISKSFSGNGFTAFQSDCGEVFFCGRAPFSPGLVDKTWMPKKYGGIAGDPYVQSLAFGSQHVMALVDSGDMWRNRSIGRLVTFLRMYVHQLRMVENEITPVCETLVGFETWLSIINGHREMIVYHERLLMKLDALLEAPTLQNYSLGSVLVDFLKDAHLLELYTTYGSGFAKAWERMLACMKSIPNLGNYLEICFARPLFQSLPILKMRHPEQFVYFLELPTLHFGQLACVIEELCRFSPDSLDRLDLLAAESSCRQSDAMIRGSVTGSNKFLGLLTFIRKFPHKRDILMPHRRFLMKASFSRSDRSPSSNSKIYVFNDLIILTNGQHVEQELLVGETFIQDVISSSPSSKPSLILVAPLQSHRLFIRSQKKQQKLIQVIDGAILEWISVSSHHREQRSLIGIRMLTNHLEMVMPLLSKSWRGITSGNTSPRFGSSPTASTSTSNILISSSLSSGSSMGPFSSTSSNSMLPSMGGMGDLSINSSLLTSMIPLLSEMVAKSCSALEADQVKRERVAVWGSMAYSTPQQQTSQSRAGRTGMAIMNSGQMHHWQSTVPIQYPIGATFQMDPIVVFMDVPGVLKEKKFSSFSKAFTKKKNKKKRAEFIFTNFGTAQSSQLASSQQTDPKRKFRVAVRLSGEVTIGEAKERLFKEALASPWAESLQLKSLPEYVLRIRGLDFYLTSEQLALGSSPMVQTILRTCLASPLIEMVALPKTGTPNESHLPTLPTIKVKDHTLLAQAMFLQTEPIPNVDLDLLLFDQLSSLIGDIRPILSPSAEITSFRHTTAGLRVQLQEEKSHFEEWLFATSPALASTTLWPQYKGLEALPSKLPTKVTLQIQLPLETNETHTLQVPPDVSIDFILNSIFRFIYKHEKHKTREKITKFVKRMLESDSPSHNNDSSASEEDLDEVAYADAKNFDLLTQSKADIHKLQPSASKPDLSSPKKPAERNQTPVSIASPSQPTQNQPQNSNFVRSQSSTSVNNASNSLTSDLDPSFADAIQPPSSAFPESSSSLTGEITDSNAAATGSGAKALAKNQNAVTPSNQRQSRLERMALRASWKAETGSEADETMKDLQRSLSTGRGNGKEIIGGSFNDSFLLSSSSSSINAHHRFRSHEQDDDRSTSQAKRSKKNQTLPSQDSIASHPASSSTSSPAVISSSPNKHLTSGSVVPTDGINSSVIPIKSDELPDFEKEGEKTQRHTSKKDRTTDATASLAANAQASSENPSERSSHHPATLSSSATAHTSTDADPSSEVAATNQSNSEGSSFQGVQTGPSHTQASHSATQHGQSSPLSSKRNHHQRKSGVVSDLSATSTSYHGANTPLIPGIEGPHVVTEVAGRGALGEGVGVASSDLALKDSKETALSGPSHQSEHSSVGGSMLGHVEGEEGELGNLGLSGSAALSNAGVAHGLEDADGRSLKLTKKEDEKLKKLRKEMGKRQKKEFERQRKEAKKAAKETMKKAKKEGVRAKKEEKKLQKHLHGGKGIEDFVLKVAGVNEFLLPGFTENRPTLLCDYDYIRRAISHQSPIELRFVEKSSVKLDSRDDLPLPLLALLPTSLMPSPLFSSSSRPAIPHKSLDMAIARFPAPPHLTAKNPHLENIKRTLGFGIIPKDAVNMPASAFGTQNDLSASEEWSSSTPLLPTSPSQPQASSSSSAPSATASSSMMTSNHLLHHLNENPPSDDSSTGGNVSSGVGSSSAAGMSTAGTLPPANEPTTGSSPLLAPSASVAAPSSAATASSSSATHHGAISAATVSSRGPHHIAISHHAKSPSKGTLLPVHVPSSSTGALSSSSSSIPTPGIHGIAYAASLPSIPVGGSSSANSSSNFASSSSILLSALSYPPQGKLQLPNDADTVEIYLDSAVNVGSGTGGGSNGGDGGGSGVGEGSSSSSLMGGNQGNVERPFWSLKDDQSAFRIRLLDAEMIGMDHPSHRVNMYVRAKVSYGHSRSSFKVMSPIIPFSNFPVFNEDLVWPFRVSDLPREARLTLTVYARVEASNSKLKKLSSDVPLAWLNVILFTEQGSLKSGIHGVRMWQKGDGGKGEGNNHHSSSSNSNSSNGDGANNAPYGANGSSFTDKFTFDSFTSPSENFSAISPILYVDICSAYRGSSSTSSSLSGGGSVSGGMNLQFPMNSFFGAPSPTGSIGSNGSFNHLSPGSSIGSTLGGGLAAGSDAMSGGSTSSRKKRRPHLHSPFSSKDTSSKHESKSAASSPPMSDDDRTTERTGSVHSLSQPSLHPDVSSPSSANLAVAGTTASSASLPSSMATTASTSTMSTEMGAEANSTNTGSNGNSQHRDIRESGYSSMLSPTSSSSSNLGPNHHRRSSSSHHYPHISPPSSVSFATSTTTHYGSGGASGAASSGGGGRNSISSRHSSSSSSRRGSSVGESNHQGLQQESKGGDQKSQTMGAKVVISAVVAIPLANVESVMTVEEKKWLSEISSRDILSDLTMEEGVMILKYRNWIKVYMPEALPKMLRFVDWSDREMVRMVHEDLKEWPPVAPYVALQLLDSRFPDSVVRKYAVDRCLGPMSDNDVYRVLLQLIQALKYESFHTSPLSIFLLRRAFWDSRRIGHFLFWQLKSEMKNRVYSERYALMMEAFLRSCSPSLRQEFLAQNKVLSWLHQIALEIKSRRGSVASKTTKLQERISKEEWPSRFNYPLDPRISCVGFQVDSCRVLGSKTVPLLITFKTEEPLSEPLQLIYKIGDDLRQDALTLQMITLMDDLWKRDGLDMRLKPYACMALSPDCGIIEVVKNAATTSNINIELGGLRAVLNHTTLLKWLKKHNPTEKMLNKAIENFIYSCAGYSVITFVLGFADRHNDNIMLSKQGHLFHIDFGHFLGHYRKVLGKYVDKTDFVFIDQYEGVMGKDNFNRFESICCQAYNVIRKYSSQFITLFTLMLASGLPELQSEQDILFIKERLQLNLTNEQAEEFFKLKLAESRDNSTIQFNHAFHVVYQGIIS
jgi:phosphatidylinositol-4,5-bisphosphate 3-kinase